MYINNKFHKFFFGSKTFLTDQLSVFNQKMYWMLFLSCIMCLNLSAIHTQYKYVCACIWRGVEVVFRCRACTIYSHGFYSCQHVRTGHADIFWVIKQRLLISLQTRVHVLKSCFLVRVNCVTFTVTKTFLSCAAPWRLHSTVKRSPFISYSYRSWDHPLMQFSKSLYG